MMTIVLGTRGQRGLEDFHARHGRHVEIAQHDVEMRAAQQLDRLVAAANHR